ncbi:MAG TPA: LamG-like jellyroll fold domain-containing protein [Candidatus Acidoferrum sp.]|nr:LamG-like jellyroll fold domain-containing protein [Candidatus Acidoferrum sp.]
MKSNTRTLLCSRPVLPFLAAAAMMFGPPAAKAASYPDTVLADSPIAYYRLEETNGTTFADSSASGAYPGYYYTDGAYPQLGQPGIDINSIGLSGAAAAYGAAGWYPDLNPQGPFSFEVWVRPTSVPTGGNYRCPIGNFGGWGSGGGNGSGWYVYQTPDSPSSFAFIMAQTGVWISTGYSLFTWYHLVGTYDGTSARFYVNGNLIGSPVAAAGFLANPGMPLGIGERGDGYGIWDGNLDEVAIYTNALTLTQIQTHYQVGTNSFRVGPTGASVRQDPASTTNYVGHTVQFSVIADGTPTLLYQWFKNGSKVNAATSSAYSFTCALADDGDSFQVIVTNNYGSATSAVATLSVSTNLLIDADLTSITRNVGSKAAFEVVAEGALPITYQWYQGASQLIPSATGSTLWLNNVQLTNDGTTYFVRVINPYTHIDSTQATLNVQARAVSVPVTGYAKIVMADDPVAYWRLDEPNGSAIATDAAGSFDGSYTNESGAGTFTFGAPTGIPHETDPGVGVTGGVTVQIPYAIELNPPTGAFTVEAWLKPDSLAANGNDYRSPLSSMSNPWGAGPTGWLVYQTAANYWSWWPYAGYWAGAQLTDTDPVVANQWYYLAMVYDGTTFTFYVNAVAKASGPYSAFVQNGNVPSGSADYNYNYFANHDPSASGPMNLGWRSDRFNPFSGSMDDVAVYNKALTPQQIQNHFLNTVRLTATLSGGNIILTWPAGTLKSSATFTPGKDSWTKLNVTSPYTVPADQAKMFYCVQLN